MSLIIHNMHVYFNFHTHTNTFSLFSSTSSQVAQTQKMINSSSQDFSQKPLKIKQDDKFFSKLLSKETSIANPSFRVYYGNVSGSVPFTWEIQPGTPKHKFSDNSLPPLTPPPSYYSSNPNHHQTKPSNTKYYPRSKFLCNLLFNINAIKKRQVASSSPSSLSSSSWSSSMSSANTSSKGFGSRRSRFRSFGSSFDDGKMYHDGSSGGSSFTVVIMKKAWLSIVGRRSA